MKKYKVAVWRTDYGFMEVEAENEQQAEDMAHEKLTMGDDMSSVRESECATEGIIN